MIVDKYSRQEETRNRLNTRVVPPLKPDCYTSSLFNNDLASSSAYALKVARLDARADTAPQIPQNCRHRGPAISLLPAYYARFFHSHGGTEAS